MFAIFTKTIVITALAWHLWDDYFRILKNHEHGSSQSCQSSNYIRLVKITIITKSENLMLPLQQRDMNLSLKT